MLTALFVAAVGCLGVLIALWQNAALKTRTFTRAALCIAALHAALIAVAFTRVA